MKGREVFDFRAFEAVFIDLDDTIVEYRNSCIEGLNEVRRKAPGISGIDIDDMEQEFREILRDNLPGLMDGKYTVDEERRLRLKTILVRHGISVDDEFLEACDSAFLDGFWNSRNVLEGADAILQFCKDEGIPVAVITNGDPGMQKRTLEMLSLEPYVDHLLTPRSSSELKPSTDLFERAVLLTGVPREKTVMIGDTYHQDILGALSSGITPVWLNRRGIRMPEDPRVIEIGSLKEIAPECNGDGKIVQ